MPLFDLEFVRNAARAGRVGMTRSPQRDYQSLGYTLEEVRDCIATLQPEHFHKVEPYEDRCECDVYLRNYRRGSNKPDDLYLKLRVPPSQVPQVLLVSFHLQR